MRHTIQSLGIDRLSVDQRIALAQEIWDSISAEELPPLSDAQRQELDRRIAEMDKNPDDVIPWEQVKAKILARTQK